MTTLVVPVDMTSLSESAVPVAASLAASLDASVRLVTVSSPGLDPLGDEVYLKSLAAPLEVPVDFVVLHADRHVEDAILEAADSDDAMLCMGAHGRTGGRILLSSVSEPLVRQARVPVILVGPCVVRPEPITRIAVCLDGSPLAERAIAPAVDLARRLGSHVELLHVAQTAGASSMHAYLESLRGRVTGVHTHTAVHFAAHASPGRVIAEHAQHAGVGLIAMTTHARTGVRRAVLGSVTQSVVHRAPCPVLVVAGFA